MSETGSLREALESAVYLTREENAGAWALTDWMGKVTEEIERLRKALEEIAFRYPEDTPDSASRREIARQALAQTKF